LIFSVFLFLLVSVSVPWVSAVDEDVTSLEVAEAEEALLLAYDSVLEAEEAGANVSGLLDKLNVGSEYLAEAYVSVRLGDSENAARLAGLCVEAVSDVTGEAVFLKDDAARLKRADFLVKAFASAAGVVIVVVSGLVLWTVFKRRYFENALGLKPEVISDES
jgi:hypothetical protein